MFIWQNVLFLSYFFFFNLLCPKRMKANPRATPGWKHRVASWALVRGILLLLVGKESKTRCCQTEKGIFNWRVRNQKRGDAYSTLTHLKTLNKSHGKVNRLFTPGKVKGGLYTTRAALLLFSGKLGLKEYIQSPQYPQRHCFPED